jgi:undecaprenyl-diphosphatase
MDKLINYFIVNITFLGNAAYWILFGVAILESSAVVGLLIPGTTAMIVAGLLASQGALDFRILLGVVAVGNIIGDTVSFYLGRRGGAWFKPGNKIFKVEYVARGELFFKKHGDKSILIARFIGPLRPIIPFVAGLFGMRALKFFIFNVIGGFLAALFYLSLGYFFGQATGRLPHLFGAVQGIVGGLIVLLILIIIFKRYVARRGEEVTTTLRLLVNPLVTVFLEHHTLIKNWLKRREQARFPLIFWFSIILAIGVGVVVGSGLIDRWLTSSQVATSDFVVTSWLFAERREWLTIILLIITGLGKTLVAVLLVGLASLLVWKNKKRIHLIALWISMGGASGMVWLVKHLVARPRPEFVAVYHETGFSFPSGHAMFAAVLGGWIIFFIWHEVREWALKVNITFFVIILMMLIGFSRLYLGVHYLSDVVGGFSVGLIWLGIGIGVQKMWLRRNQTASSALVSHPERSHSEVKDLSV